MLARFFIDRPVLAWVISIVIVLMGLIAAAEKAVIHPLRMTATDVEGNSHVALAIPDGSHVLAPEPEFTSLLFPFLAQADRGIVVERQELGSKLVHQRIVQRIQGLRAVERDHRGAACTVSADFGQDIFIAHGAVLQRVDGSTLVQDAAISGGFSIMRSR